LLGATPHAKDRAVLRSHSAGVDDPFRVESIVGVPESVGGAALAHGYDRPAFQAVIGAGNLLRLVLRVVGAALSLA